MPHFITAVEYNYAHTLRTPHSPLNGAKLYVCLVFGVPNWPFTGAIVSQREVASTNCCQIIVNHQVAPQIKCSNCSLHCNSFAAWRGCMAKGAWAREWVLQYQRQTARKVANVAKTVETTNQPWKLFQLKLCEKMRIQTNMEWIESRRRKRKAREREVAEAGSTFCGHDSGIHQH